jgi:pyruvate,water dikinase
LKSIASKNISGRKKKQNDYEHNPHEFIDGQTRRRVGVIVGCRVCGSGKILNEEALLTHEYVLVLADPKATLANVGGKGASLARLANAGLPVPDGFHITTEAYKQFVAQNDLQPHILAALESVAASQLIRDLFASTSMPTAVAEAIGDAYLALNRKLESANRKLPVAVRSSATAEDLSNLSFAGQQETYLNIKGIAAVRDAVKQCWASLWTPRAIDYRTRHKIDHNAIALAVVVQVLVPADVTGILFTANPVTGARNQIVIDAAWGLGEAIVGGAVTPDTFIVDKIAERIIEKEIADKQVMTVLGVHGTEAREVPAHLRRVAALNDDQVIELARLGRQIEKIYTVPMDIEWTRAENKFAIVQARPITTLPESIE